MLLKLLLTPPCPGQPADESQEKAATVDSFLEADSSIQEADSSFLEADSSFLEADSSFLEADSSSLVFHVANSAMITQSTGPDNLQVKDGCWHTNWGFWPEWQAH